MSVLCAFTIDTRPIPKARPRVVKGHTYTDERTAAFEALVAHHAQRAMSGRDVIDGEVRLSVLFEQTDARPADIDNLLKSLMDGMSSIRASKRHAGRIGPVLRNDSQVIEVHARLIRKAPADRVSVAVTTTTKEQQP